MSKQIQAKIKRLEPRSKGFIQAKPLPAINSMWLKHDIRPTHTPSGIRTTVGVTAPGVLSVRIKNRENRQYLAFNQGVGLSAASIYVFEFMVHHGDSINYLYSTTGGTIQVLRVEEIDSSVV